jgi:hypothetical protein
MRQFIIGSTVIEEDPSFEHLTNDEVIQRLAATYPELKTATITTTEVDGVTRVQAMAAPGRKG